MATYYEILSITPTATDSEIQTAWDSMYNHWRKLVTHHDQQVVIQANQALQTLEKIRSTLTNPIARSEYDAQFSLPHLGGLADMSAAHPVAPVPPFQSSAAPVPYTAQTTPINDNLWICPNCRSGNPKDARFCKKCGAQLRRNCPKCSAFFETAAQFCPVCGVNVRDYERELEMRAAEIEVQRIAEQRRMVERSARLGPIIAGSEKASSFAKIGWIISLVGMCIPYVNFVTGFVALGFWSVAIYQSSAVLRQSQAADDSEYRRKAKNALWLSVIPIGLTLIGMALIFMYIIGALVLSGTNY